MYPEFDYWHPRQELLGPPNSTLTLLSVTSLHNYHIKPTYDPIFLAIEPQYTKGCHDTYYVNSDPRARTMACADVTEICSPDGASCWSMSADVGEDFPAPYWLMKWSLESSTIKDAITWRLGSALIAQDRVSQYRSLPLPDNHWEAEAARLFETSLARIHFDAWSIASGEDRELPGYIELTPDEARGQLCGLYKFNSTGYSNINFGAFFGLLLAAVAVGVLSIKAKHIRSLLYWISRREHGASDAAASDWEPLTANIGFKWLVIIILSPFWLMFIAASRAYRSFTESAGAAR